MHSEVSLTSAEARARDPRLLAGRDVVCISSIDFGTLWQAHQEICSRLARDSSRVVYIENTGARMVRLDDFGRIVDRARRWFRSRRTHGVHAAEPRLSVLSPIVLPPASAITRAVNRAVLLPRVARTIHDLGVRDPIVWTFLPTRTSLDLYDLIRTPASRLVYYCVADFEQLTHRPEIRDIERRTVERADVVFANRPELATRFRQWSDNVHVFPVGVNLNAFTPGSAVAERIRTLPRPRIGCVGALHELKSDFSFLAAIARLRPDWSWVYVGPKMSSTAVLDGLPNVTLVGDVPHSALASYIEGFDVCIVPYRESDFMRTAVPTKINEYLAMGKPVVATPSFYADEMQAEGAIGVAPHDPHDFVAAVEAALDDTSVRQAMQRRKFATRADWSERLAEMCAHIRAVF